MEYDFNKMKKWMEERFAFQRLDNALLILSSLVNVVFAVGNSIYGGGWLAFVIPLYFISWVMPIWSGYFLGAVLRKNLVDKMRGWIYLLSGTASYFATLITIPWVHLPLGPSQLDQLTLPTMVFQILLYNGLIVFVSWAICVRLVRKLFKTAVSNNIDSTVHFSSRPFLFTYFAIWSFTSMSSFYVWDALRRVLDPSVFSVELLLCAGIIFFLVGLLFESLATKTTKRAATVQPLDNYLGHH